MKTREEILTKAAEFDGAEEGSIEEDTHRLLLEIAGKDAESMLSDDAAEELLHCADIYHFQSHAVRVIRKFLA
jgi:hypothetical protein